MWCLKKEGFLDYYVIIKLKKNVQLRSIKIEHL
jgi:hypothetical protein